MGIQGKGLKRNVIFDLINYPSKIGDKEIIQQFLYIDSTISNWEEISGREWKFNGNKRNCYSKQKSKKACFVSSTQTMETSYLNYFTHVHEYPYSRLPTLNVWHLLIV